MSNVSKNSGTAECADGWCCSEFSRDLGGLGGVKGKTEHISLSISLSLSLSLALSLYDLGWNYHPRVSSIATVRKSFFSMRAADLR